MPTTFPWDNLTGTPTTLLGYGITDAAGAITSFPYDNLTGVPTTFPYDNLTGVPTTFPYDNLTGVPTTFPYDNLTGVPAAFSVADNSITPAKLSHTVTPDNTLFYRGDGEWVSPSVSFQDQIDAKQDYDADLAVLSFPTAWRLFYSNGSQAITELTPGDNNTYLKSNGASAAPTFSTVTAVGNADTATALAANGSNCPAGQSPLGVNASGAVEGCWTPTASLDNTTMDNTVVGGTTPVAGTFTTLTATAVVFTGGAIDNLTNIDNTPIGSTTPAAGSFSSLTRGSVSNTEFGYLDGVTSAIQTQLNLKRALDNVTFTGMGPVTIDNEITVTQVNTTCSYSDNTCGINISVSGPPATAPSGDIIWDNTAKALKVGNGTTFDTIASTYKYYKGAIDTPVAGDNTIYDGPLEFAQVWDNVVFIVQDNTGKLSGSASDNVTLNFSYCSSISVPTCTNVFTSAPTPTGAAILAPSLNNTTPSAGDYVRISIGESNMTYKKLYIRIRYKE